MFLITNLVLEFRSETHRWAPPSTTPPPLCKTDICHKNRLVAFIAGGIRATPVELQHQPASGSPTAPVITRRSCRRSGPIGPWSTTDHNCLPCCDRCCQQVTASNPRVVKTTHDAVKAQAESAIVLGGHSDGDLGLIGLAIGTLPSCLFNACYGPTEFRSLGDRGVGSVCFPRCFPRYVGHGVQSRG